MHFHVFMKFVHSSIFGSPFLRVELHELKRANFKGDYIYELANSLVSESSILCLDEFQVSSAFKLHAR